MSETPLPTSDQKNVRNPNHHYFANKYCNTPPICTAIHLQCVLQHFRCPLCFEERELLSVLLQLVSQCASHLYCITPPMCIAVLLGKSWWSWSPGCSPSEGTNINFVWSAHLSEGRASSTRMTDGPRASFPPLNWLGHSARLIATPFPRVKLLFTTTFGFPHPTLQSSPNSCLSVSCLG